MLDDPGPKYRAFPRPSCEPSLSSYSEAHERYWDSLKDGTKRESLTYIGSIKQLGVGVFNGGLFSAYQNDTTVILLSTLGSPFASQDLHLQLTY